MAITRWTQNQAILEALRNNSITIEQLTAENLPSLQKLLTKNKKNKGYSSMEENLFDGTKLAEIISPENKSMTCFVAKQKFSDEVVGFVDFEITRTKKGKAVAGIHEIGVDWDYSSQSEKRIGKNIGFSLFLIACNEIFATSPDTKRIHVMAANHEIMQLCVKAHFTQSEVGDEFYFTRENYQLIEKEFIAKSQIKQRRVDAGASQQAAADSEEKERSKPSNTPSQ